MVEYARYLMLLAAGLLVPLCFMLWVIVIDRVLQEQEMLPAEPRRPVPWTLLDMVIVAFFGVGTMLISQAINRYRLDLPAEGGWRLRDLTPDQQVGLLQSFSVSGALVLLLGLLIIRFRPRSTWADIGVVGKRFVSDVKLGACAFIMLFFPMTLIHLTASYFIPMEEQHPFIEVIIKDPQLRFLIPIAFAAVVIAPLAEEFFFRVMAQGWLERIVAQKEWELLGGESMALAPRQPNIQQPNTQPPEAQQPAAAGETATQPAAEPSELGAADGQESLLPQVEPPPELALPTRPGLRWLPILVTSFLFAVAHAGQGPAPIPLFFLALGLGYLYQKTHRWVPCVVVHFLVNLAAILQMGVAILQAGQQG